MITDERAQSTKTLLTEVDKTRFQGKAIAVHASELTRRILVVNNLSENKKDGYIHAVSHTFFTK